LHVATYRDANFVGMPLLFFQRSRNKSAAPAVSIGKMVLLGRLHPLLVHFPIGLVMLAAVAEAGATLTKDRRWRTIALSNVRAGAALAVLAAVAGWRLASAPGMEASALLESHRWFGATATCAAVAAALASARADCMTRLEVWIYRISLFAAAALVALTGHLGGALVWGADFLRM